MSELLWDRICTACMVRWFDTSRECPKCGNGAFLTMNCGDIGTAMYLEHTNTSLSDFKKITRDK